ncbi:hypothetical protein TWF481_002995 [Arthrobotrys musiformis]|uniref:Uncharacterized protein n=1 Tax=Arthrobotrys musiformis TaxID=47236 RepID=A0AAV9VRV5_9PEZI
MIWLGLMSSQLLKQSLTKPEKVVSTNPSWLISVLSELYSCLFTRQWQCPVGGDPAAYIAINEGKKVGHLRFPQALSRIIANTVTPDIKKRWTIRQCFQKSQALRNEFAKDSITMELRFQTPENGDLNSTSSSILIPESQTSEIPLITHHSAIAVTEVAGGDNNCEGSLSSTHYLEYSPTTGVEDPNNSHYAPRDAAATATDTGPTFQKDKSSSHPPRALVSMLRPKSAFPEEDLTPLSQEDLGDELATICEPSAQGSKVCREGAVLARKTAPSAKKKGASAGARPTRAIPDEYVS